MTAAHNPAGAPITGAATVSNLTAALADINPDTPVAVQAGPGALLWINEVNLIGVQEIHAVDETTVSLPASYVVLVVEPPKPPLSTVNDTNVL